MPLSAEFKYILRNRSFLNFLGFSALISKDRKDKLFNVPE